MANPSIENITFEEIKTKLQEVNEKTANKSTSTLGKIFKSFTGEGAAKHDESVAKCNKWICQKMQKTLDYLDDLNCHEPDREYFVTEIYGKLTQLLKDYIFYKKSLGLEASTEPKEDEFENLLNQILTSNLTTSPKA